MTDGDTTSHRLQAPPPASCSSVPLPGPTSVALSTVVPGTTEARPSPGCIMASCVRCGLAGVGGGIKHLLGGLTSACTYPYLKRLYCEQINPLTPWGAPPLLSSERHSGSHFPDRVSGTAPPRPDPSLSTRPPPSTPNPAPAPRGRKQQFQPPCLHRPHFFLSWSFQLAHECAAISLLSGKSKNPLFLLALVACLSCQQTP